MAPIIFHIPKSVKCRIPIYSHWVSLREGHNIKSSPGQYLNSEEVIGKATEILDDAARKIGEIADKLEGKE